MKRISVVFALVLALLLLALVGASAESTATVGDVTVSGKVDEAITPADVTLTVVGDKFNAIDADTDVTGWFINIPVGLEAKIKTAVAADSTSIVIAVSGTPAMEYSKAMAIEIPIKALASGTSVNVSENPNAKWDIAKNGEYVMEVTYKDGEVKNFSNREAGWNDALKYDGSTVKLLADWKAVNGSFGKGLGFGYMDNGKIVDAGNIHIPYTGGSVTLDLNGHTIDRGLTEPRDEGCVILIENIARIKNGTIKGGNNTKQGGGITANSTAPAVVLNKITLSGNKAQNGGGIWSDSDTRLYDVTIKGNTATNGGGGVIEVQEMYLFLFGDTQITGNKLADGTPNNLECFVSADEELHSYVVLEEADDELAKTSKIGLSFALMNNSIFPCDVTVPADEDYSGCFSIDKGDYTISDYVDSENKHSVRVTRPEKHNKPYVVTSTGEEVEYISIQLALDAAKPTETVMVPVRYNQEGDLTIPEGVNLVMGNKVVTNASNLGKLVIGKNGSLSTSAGETVHINHPASGKDDEAAAYFVSIDVSGVYSNGGALNLYGTKATGDGRIDVTGEITLNGESALGDVKLKLGDKKTVTLGETFTAQANAATILLGNGYASGRKVLTLKGSDQGKYVQYFKLGDAPDTNWFINESGVLKRAGDPENNYLLLDKMTLGKDKKLAVSNILPVNFKGSVTWTSDAEAVLKIAGKGAKASLKPVGLGTATLTATFDDGTVQTVAVTVIDKKEAATGLEMKKKLTVKIGETKTPEAKVKPATALDKTLMWFTSNEAIATVSDSGTITAVSKGKCKVYAITTAGVRKVITVTVKK